jgi:hypothetical protein
MELHEASDAENKKSANSCSNFVCVLACCDNVQE